MAEEPKKVEIVGNVSISTDPKRTIGDYEQEQKEARDRHQMFQEQHRLIQRSFYMNIFAVTAAIAAALAAIWTAYNTAENKPQAQADKCWCKKAQEQAGFQGASTTTKKPDK